jgi:carbon monoxide dehydrogenase subunit G
MELNNEFRVGVSVPEAWKVLTDVERIAPLLPGAQLQEVEGDEYRGVVKVKVGPITAQYKGAATFIEQDEAAGKVVLKASGRDTRGQGNATATITVTMSPDGEGTKVAVLTDLTVTGKVAQFGRGVMADVSGKLMGQFVDALEADLASSGAAPTGAAEGSAAGSPETPASPASSGSASSGSENREPGGATATGANGSGPAATVSAGPRRIEGPEAEPVDLLAVAGGSTLKRLVPVVGVVALIVAVLLRRRSRRASGLASRLGR